MYAKWPIDKQVLECFKKFPAEGLTVARVTSELAQQLVTDSRDSDYRAVKRSIDRLVLDGEIVKAFESVGNRFVYIYIGDIPF